MRITLLNQKGGVGKSTVALLLAGTLKKAGYDVALDDRDPQSSATFYAETFGVPSLEENPDAEFIITDTPGHMRIEGQVKKEMAKLIGQSDKLILVSEKSPASIHGSAPMAELVKAHKGKKAKAYVLFNKVRTATAVGRQSGKAIAKELGLPALSNELPLAASFDNSFVLGLAAVKGKNRSQLLNLALEIMK